MKKTIIPIVILYSFVSCVLDTMESMSIKNCTKDTVIVGASFSSSIDSVYMGEYGRFRFYDRLGAKWDSTWTVMNNKGMLDISKNELIPPDSMAAYAEPGRRNHLYDTLVVTREMLERTGNKIEYK